MINPRFFFNEASLSPFLTGVTVFDPFGEFLPRTINELARRKDVLSAAICPPGAGTTDGGTPPDAGAPAD